MNIELTDKQAALVRFLCEAYARMTMGQFGMAFSVLFPEISHDDQREIDALLKRVFPERQNMDEAGTMAWDINQVIRQYLALSRVQDGIALMTVDFDDPLKLGTEPLAAIAELAAMKKREWDIIPDELQSEVRRLRDAWEYTRMWRLLGKIPRPYQSHKSERLVEREDGRLVLEVDSPRNWTF